ncbi:hypothetical protein JCM11641_005207 [Rhodosporidiobolus odoratus]
MFTPAEDLNGPLDQLSLSPSSPFALRSKFTLKCSDGETSRSTPRCFTAPLVSSRTCWTRAAENSCEVSEIKGDSESSLIALKEGKPPADEEEWATMYKGQDKYDVPALRSMFSMPPHSTVNAAPLSIYIMALQYLQVARGAADVSLKEGLASASASTVYQKLPAMDRTNLSARRSIATNSSIASTDMISGSVPSLYPRNPSSARQSGVADEGNGV